MEQKNKYSYLNVIYDQDIKPYTDYPPKLANYFCDNLFKVRKGRLLDIGCGRGEYLKIFGDIGFETFGVDKESLAKEKGFKVSVLEVDKEKLPFENNYFDVVFSKSVIEHLVDVEHYISEIYRVLKPGGKVLITTCDWTIAYKYFYNDYQHKSPMTIVSMENLLTVYGFKNIKVFNMYQLPFTWKYPLLKFIPIIIKFLPIRFKDNTKIYNKMKLLRFSKELLLVGFGIKS